MFVTIRIDLSAQVSLSPLETALSEQAPGTRTCLLHSCHFAKFPLQFGSESHPIEMSPVDSRRSPERASGSAVICLNRKGSPTDEEQSVVTRLAISCSMNGRKSVAGGELNETAFLPARGAFSAPQVRSGKSERMRRNPSMRSLPFQHSMVKGPAQFNCKILPRETPCDAAESRRIL